MNILAFLVLMSGIAISVCGAYFSIIGLKLLFVGGGISIIIMGTALEVGKLITATFLKQKWKEIGWWMKTYMLLATLFLMGITSIGIYGYLSAGYTATSIAVQGYEQNIESNNTKIKEFEAEIETIKKSDYNAEEIANIDVNRKKFIEQKLQVVAQKNQQIENIRKSANTTQDASADIAAAKQALEISKSSTDTDIARELEQVKLYNSRLEILDKEVQKWMDEGAGGLFKKSGLDKARTVKEGQAKERADIDAQIKSAQDRIEKLREQYATQVKEYNDRVAAIEGRSKNQRSDIEANVKKLEKDIEEIMASIDAYNKESDNKVSSLNSKKDELADLGKKKVIEYQNEIQTLRNQNTDYKDKIVKTDVGTFKFIAKSLGVPLDTAVNYFIWSIMLVFDPLAVCLILAYNTLVGKSKKKEESAELSEITNIEKKLETTIDFFDKKLTTAENSGSFEGRPEETKEIIKYVEVPKEIIKYEQIPEAIRSNFSFLVETKSINLITNETSSIYNDLKLSASGSELTESIYENTSSFETGSFFVSLVETGSVEISSSHSETSSMVAEVEIQKEKIIKPATPNQPLPPPAFIRKQEHFSRPPRSNYIRT